MKKTALAVVILTLIAPLGAAFPIYSYIDTPSQVGTTVFIPGSFVGGWALDIRTGQFPTCISVLDTVFGDNGAQQQWLPVTDGVNFFVVDRPDVQVAFALQSPHVGYMFYPSGLSPGIEHFLSVFVGDCAISRSETVTVVY